MNFKINGGKFYENKKLLFFMYNLIVLYLEMVIWLDLEILVIKLIVCVKIK